MSETTEPNSVKKQIDVKAPLEVAWRVFTQEMRTWWPLAHYKIGKTVAIDAVIESRVGGRWYEKGDDGTTTDWGRVLVWDPPSRLVLTWDITADWQYDPTLNTEIEVRFSAAGRTTHAELEHRKLDRFGARRDEMRRIFDTEGDWGRQLAAFAAAAEPYPALVSDAEWIAAASQLIKQRGAASFLRAMVANLRDAVPAPADRDHDAEQNRPLKSATISRCRSALPACARGQSSDPGFRLRYPADQGPERAPLRPEPANCSGGFRCFGIDRRPAPDRSARCERRRVTRARYRRRPRGGTFATASVF